MSGVSHFPQTEWGNGMNRLGSPCRYIAEQALNRCMGGWKAEEGFAILTTNLQIRLPKEVSVRRQRGQRTYFKA